jgi:hypothetical protein
MFYVDSGASDHLILSRGLCPYKEFATPVEISAANNGKIGAYGSGTLRVAATVNGAEREQDLEGVYYAPRSMRDWCRLGSWRARDGTSAYVTAEWSRGIGTGTCSPISRG